uniref:Tapasin-related protein-like n=1 Tax=Erpetoichthys calabaricus TaxID=27687 RepID=A0A8C4SVX5_ERPCA
MANVEVVRSYSFHLQINSQDQYLQYVKLIFLLLVMPGAMAIFHIYTPQAEIRASLHSDVFLPCFFSLANSKNELKYVVVTWKCNGVRISQYMNGEVKSSSRAEMLENELKMGNASLILRNVNVNDKGDYECVVYEVPNLGKVNVSLKLTAAPQVFIKPPVIAIDRIKLLECHVVGFYPENISVEWWSHSRPLFNMTPLLVYQNPDGTYSTVRHLNYTSLGMNVGETLSCQVTHESREGNPIKIPLQICEPVLTLFPQTVSIEGKHDIVCQLKGCFFRKAVISWIHKNTTLTKYTCMDTRVCENKVVITVSTTKDKTMEERGELLCEAKIKDFDMLLTQPVTFTHKGKKWICLYGDYE